VRFLSSCCRDRWRFCRLFAALVDSRPIRVPEVSLASRARTEHVPERN
jgi:hypothetical protein